MRPNGGDGLMFFTRKTIGLALCVLALSGIAFAGPESKPAPSVELARSLIDAEQFEQAVAVLKQLDPGDANTSAQIGLLFGRIYLAIGKPAKALGYFEEASFASLDGEAEAYLGLAEADLALGDLAKARRNAALALRSDPDLIAAHLVLARADQRIGKAATRIAGQIVATRVSGVDLDGSERLTRIGECGTALRVHCGVEMVGNKSPHIQPAGAVDVSLAST